MNRKSFAVLCVAVAMQTLVVAAQEAESGRLTTFGSILARVTQRDAETQAIVSLAALPDAPACPQGLRLSMQRVPMSSDVMIELRAADNAEQMFESYRLKADSLITREIEQLGNYAKQPSAAGNNAKPATVFLRVPHARQAANLCAPTSASMVLHYYGDKVSPRQVKTWANAVTTDRNFAGTYFVDLVKVLQQQGYEWQAMGYTVSDEGFNVGFARILASLDAGEPVLVDTYVPPDGHTILVTGYDPGKRRLALLDPNIPAPGIRTVTYDDFRPLWRAVIKDVRGCIFTHRKIPVAKVAE